MRNFTDAELTAQIPRVRRYARALTRDADRAEDLLQDTIVRALEKHELYEPGTNLRAWLFTLCQSLRLAAIRRECAAPAAFGEAEPRIGERR